MSFQEKQLHYANHKLVRIGDKLHPITHTFITRRRLHIDGVLEFYNQNPFFLMPLHGGTFVSGSPLMPNTNLGMVDIWTAPWNRTSLRSVITFACTPIRDGRIFVSPPYRGISSMLVRSGINSFSWVTTDLLGNIVQPRIFNGGQVIGDDNSPIPNGSNPESPTILSVPVGEITTLTVDALPPDPHETWWSPFPSVDYLGRIGTRYSPDWWGQTFLRPQQDFVIWIYSIAIQGYHLHWDGSWDNFMMDMPAPSLVPASSWPEFFPRNDGVFLPGQSGVRVISQSWQNAPWERYPHLL
jgi:hypothetical protein